MSSEFALKAHGGRWKSYPIYKDSSVEWLGKVPEGWGVQKLKHITKINLSNVDKKTNEGEDPIKLCNYLDVYNNDYITSDLNFMEATASSYQIDKFALIEGDVIITKDSESWEDIAIPAYVTAHLKGVICGYHLAHIRPKSDINGEYLFWSFCVPRLNHQFRIEAHGITRFGLGKYSIDNSLFLLPPIDEQKLIASFLCRETRQIDFLISKKERQIELLQKKRAALISHAITKGLDPDVKLKDSGIEWLGEVPEHWRIIRLKYAFILMRGFDLSSDMFLNGSYPVYGSNGIIGHHDQYTTMGPSITVGRSGSVGEVNYIESNFWAHNTALYVKYFKLAYPKFAFYLLKTLDLKSLSAGSAVGTLNRNYIHDLTIGISNYSEQCAIASFLDCETANLDALTAKIRNSIEKLREYRTALISAAVTGKIDVRKDVMT